MKIFFYFLSLFQWIALHRLPVLPWWAWAIVIMVAAAALGILWSLRFWGWTMCIAFLVIYFGLSLVVWYAEGF